MARIAVEVKYCRDCDETKPVDGFYKDSANSTGFQTYCKSCQYSRTKRARDKAPERYRGYSRKFTAARYQRHREFLAEHKNKPCADCGGSYPAFCMDFHHRDPMTKDFSLSASKSQNLSRDVVLLEIAKCDVLCANCHRIRHYAEKSQCVPV